MKSEKLTDEGALREIMPNEKKRKIKNYNILFWFVTIIVSSIFIGFILSNFINFNQEILFWMASTIAQAFGAMLAIIIAIVIFRMRTIEELTSKRREELMKNLLGSFDKILMSIKQKNPKELEEGIEVYEKTPKLLFEIWKGELQTIEDFRNRMSYIIIPMALLIFSSLFILLFSKISIRFLFNIDTNFLISLSLSFLFLYSAYCLIILIYEIHAMMEWKRRVDFLFPDKKLKLER